MAIAIGWQIKWTEKHTLKFYHFITFSFSSLSLTATETIYVRLYGIATFCNRYFFIEYFIVDFAIVKNGKFSSTSSYVVVVYGMEYIVWLYHCDTFSFLFACLFVNAILLQSEFLLSSQL